MGGGERRGERGEGRKEKGEWRDRRRKRERWMEIK